MADHFVIEINIKSVKSKPDPLNNRSREPQTSTEREIEDVVRVVTKADAKDEALVKAIAILQLERD